MRAGYRAGRSNACAPPQALPPAACCPPDTVIFEATIDGTIAPAWRECQGIAGSAFAARAHQRAVEARFLLVVETGVELGQGGPQRFERVVQGRDTLPHGGEPPGRCEGRACRAGRAHGFGGFLSGGTKLVQGGALRLGRLDRVVNADGQPTGRIAARTACAREAVGPCFGARTARRLGGFRAKLVESLLLVIRQRCVELLERRADRAHRVAERRELLLERFEASDRRDRHGARTSRAKILRGLVGNADQLVEQRALLGSRLDRRNDILDWPVGKTRRCAAAPFGKVGGCGLSGARPPGRRAAGGSLIA